MPIKNSMLEDRKILLQYNDSYIEGEYEIKDGTSNVKERGEMISWNGMPHLQDFWWSSDEVCSSLQL